jgi:predicted nucleic acid-binding protein
MKTQDLVLVDTCIWVSFFNRPRSAAKRAVDELPDDHRAAIVGPIPTEILCGFRKSAEADWVASLLRGVQYIELTWNDWRDAAALGRELVARGHQLPITDLVATTATMRRDCAVFTTDPHFDLLPQLKRFPSP